jgi:uncharacterized protein (TIGR02145 family)
MRKIFIILSICIMASMISCGQSKKTSIDNEGVVINGVKWATRNVDTPGTFTKNPEDYGVYYTWDEAQNVCPLGWRVPTLEEIESLLSVENNWITLNGINGRQFSSSNVSLFFPAAGFRYYNDSISNNVGTEGGYWSSTATTDNGHGLGFYHEFADWTIGSRKSFQCVRCVAE